MVSAVHDMTLVIPVADRPRQLADCLHSFSELLRRYPYSGRLTVVVAEDSTVEENIRAHRQLLGSLETPAVEGIHLDHAMQKEVLQALPGELAIRLGGVLGNGVGTGHKGASITRNLALLWLAKRLLGREKQLIWFLDSDQLFRINRPSASADREEYALDYLHELDRIFTTTDARIVTGKVVGDPPVSPAVMMGNFLDDVILFLQQWQEQVIGQACSFHGKRQEASDAAYHDMADLFGFGRQEEFVYCCGLEGEHDHLACMEEFVGRLQGFFDGVHPTRRSYYQPGGTLSSVAPARTVYTGNYVLDASQLQWFIPFADLGLRMAGPTLGRLVKAGLGEHFVSANLPMLHRRAMAGEHHAEFRRGIRHQAGSIDLTDEFVRQYFGDVLLFGMEKLTARGFPQSRPGASAVQMLVRDTDSEMLLRYRSKQERIGRQLAHLQELVSGVESRSPAGMRTDRIRTGLTAFIHNIHNNFTDHSRAWAMLNDEGYREQRRDGLVSAILAYPQLQVLWQQALASLRGG